MANGMGPVIGHRPMNPYPLLEDRSDFSSGAVGSVNRALPWLHDALCSGNPRTHDDEAVAHMIRKVLQAKPNNATPDAVEGGESILFPKICLHMSRNCKN